MCGYVACVLECCGSILYTSNTHSICISSNSEESKKLPDNGRLLPKHVGASIQNKGVVQSVHIVGHFYYFILLMFRNRAKKIPLQARTLSVPGG
jgi:hypothetical protein